MPMRITHAVVLVLCLCLVSACGEVWNDPYPDVEKQQGIIYEFFNSRPKHLDPVQSYVEDEAWFVYSTYEPLYDYHQESA